MISAFGDGGIWNFITPSGDDLFMVVCPIFNTIWAIDYFSKSWSRDKMSKSRSNQKLINRFFGIK